MGLGCNAVGVAGCRIIQSPRERMIALLTNSLVPCNGRFPALIALISMFFAFGSGIVHSLTGTFLLLAVLMLSLFVTFLCSWFLSRTILSGMTSAFALELPPYRQPKWGEVLIRSLLDRTLFVLGRAVAVAAPAGAVVWCLSNLQINGVSLLQHFSSVLDPAGRLLGMDGVILLAFILGFPANELVLPMILMIYQQHSVLMELQGLETVRQILLQNGWTLWTALSVVVFLLFHWPCSTTVLTIWKETHSVRWTSLGVLLPTGAGIVLCLLIRIIRLLPL